MGWLTETPTWPGVAPLLLWIKILEVLAVVLLAMALLTVIVGWVRHLPWWVRLSALVPLAASIGDAMTVHMLRGTYAFWSDICNFCCGHACPISSFPHAQHVAAAAAHMAAVLGWFGIAVAGLWLILGFVGLRRHEMLSPAVRP